jgi:serine/threonine protein kinase
MDLDSFLEYPGRFRLVRKIAEGGMATVYEAEQLGPAGFTKRTALKVIHSHYAKQGEFLQLFVDEAKLSANLVHGNVVQIYQLGEVSGRYFIAMEYIQGPTLRSIIDTHRDMKAPMPPTLAAYVASRVCRALDFAHNFVDSRGRRLDIVHRDVSPGNVMATWDGHIKLADFGIAKARTSIDPAESRPMMMGKKHYMSPEQMLGLAVDARSDVFSLGVVLFEMLALTPLFHEDITRPRPRTRADPRARPREGPRPAPHRRRDGACARLVVPRPERDRHPRPPPGPPAHDLPRYVRPAIAERRRARFVLRHERREWRGSDELVEENGGLDLTVSNCTNGDRRSSAVPGWRRDTIGGVAKQRGGGVAKQLDGR